MIKPLSPEAIERAEKNFAPPENEKRVPKQSFSGNRLDVKAYLEKYGREVVKIKNNGSSTLYCLENCVFDEGHANNEAAIGQTAEGKLFYQCFHNSCKGKTWPEARQIISGNDPLFKKNRGTKEENRSLPEKAQDYHFTDMGNAERLVDLYGQNFRYCYPFKRWFVWDANRWNGDKMGLLRRMCKDMIKGMYKEASEIDDDKTRKALMQYAFKCETVKKSRDMMEFAQSENGVPILPEHLDNDTYLINCLNGTIDLRTGELKPHRREDLITKLAPANYNPDAECTAWLDHLDKIMDGNQDLIKFLQKAFGYSLTGDTSERKIFIQYGSGANGKSVTNDTIALVMGDYAIRTPTETLLIKRNDGIPSDIARLRGARFVYASEAEQGKRLAESLIKDMSGGDKITARFLHQEWFEFYPEFKIWLGTNHKPIIRGTDPAIWDRIRLIPFMVRIPDHEQVPKTEMLELFQDEIDGIFSWLVEGCLAWQKEGLGLPEEIKAATTNYRNEMDILSNFLDERCVFGENRTVSAKELYEEYVKWAEANGEDIIKKKMFGIKLNERNVDTYKGTNNITMRAGIGLQVNE